MNEKINLQELTALLSEKAAITKKDAEVFLRTYFEIMNEDIIKSGLLKIKDLGSFKLSLMEDRESIDVTTGDRVLIPAHYKIVFTPDKKLAETVNEPFALFETMEIEEESEPDELNLLSDEDASEDFEKTSVEEELKSEDLKLISEEDALNDFEPTSVDSAQTSVAEKKFKRTANFCLNCYDYEAHYLYKGKYLVAQKKLIRSRIIILILSIILAVAFGYILYLFHFEKQISFKEFFYFSGKSQSEQVNYAIQNTSVSLKDSIALTEKPEKSEIKEINDKPLPQQKSDNPKEVIVAPGQRLTSIAENEYGDKVFWVYIYIENKAAISNPDILHVGAKIFVPPAEKYGIDSNDPASVQKAKEMANKILKDF